MKSDAYKACIDTIKYSEVDLTNAAAVFYPGGHGPMFDLAKDEDTAAKTAKFFDDGGLVGALCHGPAALVPIKLKSGDSIVKGRTVTGFSNSEEEIMKLTK